MHVQLRNRNGTAIDPVPFFVVVATAFLLCFSYGPVYCMALGLSGPVVFLAPGSVFLAASVGAYHRLVWTFRPEYRQEIPPDQRLARLWYAVLVGLAVIGGLSLPFLVP